MSIDLWWKSSHNCLDKKTREQKFWERVDKDGSLNSEIGNCWLWTGYIERCGYGRLKIKVDGKWKMLQAHRVSWMLEKGEYPKYFILHKCDTRNCVRPDHLFEGTQLDNMADMTAKGRGNRRFRSQGEKGPNSKLTKDDILSIYKMLKNGVKRVDIATKYKCSPSLITLISKGKNWKHLYEEYFIHSSN